MSSLLCLAKRFQSGPGYLLSLFVQHLWPCLPTLPRWPFSQKYFPGLKHNLIPFSAFFSAAFFFFSDTSFSCADPQTPDAEYHSIQDILPGIAQGTFSVKPCLVLFPCFHQLLYMDDLFIWLSLLYNISSIESRIWVVFTFIGPDSSTDPGARW